MAYGDEVVGDDGEIAYSNQIDNYSPEALSTSILDGFIGELPAAPKPVAAPISPEDEAKKANKEKQDKIQKLNKVRSQKVIDDAVKKGWIKTKPDGSYDFTPEGLKHKDEFFKSQRAATTAAQKNTTKTKSSVL